MSDTVITAETPVAAKPKAPRKLKAPVTKTATAAKTAPEKVAKPAVAMHDFQSDWTQPSGPLNNRPSKTAVDFGKFGSLLEAALTDRDRKSLAAIRAEFQKKRFTRANIDAGILRRLGERGLIRHIAGSDVSPQATFELTARAFSKEASAS